MDSIASYESSDSDNNLCDDEKPDNNCQESKKKFTEHQDQLSNRQQSDQVQGTQLAKWSTVLSIKHVAKPVLSVSELPDSCILSSNNDNLQQHNSENFKRCLADDGGFRSVSTKDVIKPYIPKSKRAKLVDEPENIDKRIISPSITPSANLSLIFQKAQAFSKSHGLKYRLPKGQVVDFEGHQGCVNRIVWNPRFSDFLLSASMDSAVNVWNVQSSPCCVQQVKRNKQAVKDAKWSHDGLQILSCGYDKVARITDINLGRFNSFSIHWMKPYVSVLTVVNRRKPLEELPYMERFKE